MSQEQKPTRIEGLHAFCELFRAVARPAVTIMFAAVIAQVVIEGRTPPDWFLALAIPTIAWWFTERTVTHIQERRKEDQ